jgi:hypothetical protein
MDTNVRDGRKHTHVTGGRHKRWLWSIALFVVAGLMFVPALLLAVHDTNAFELDGNAVNGLPAGDDWDNVCHQVTAAAQCATASNTTGATAVSWVPELNLNASIFTGGGSKDPIDINQWAWKDGAGGLPDKDNLLHSFAARYSLTPTGAGGACPSNGPTCEVLFFGSDRYDNSGDAQQGFWFFQNKITLGTNSVGGGTGFVGLHKPGDLLVVSDFSNGGTTSTITVYSWDPTCKKAGGTCGDANLRILASSNAANCASATGGDGFCGIVNPTNGTTAPWAYTDKTGNNTYLQGEFYEGGINLSSLGLGGECFATVASETRSSTSTTATLKDFVLGSFGKCETGLTTQASASSVSIGSGSASVTDAATLTISGKQTWTGTLQFYLCGPGASTCDSSGKAIGSGMTVTNATSQPIVSTAATVTSVGDYCWAAVFTSGTDGVPNATDDTTNECFTVTAKQPTLTTSATGTVTIGAAISDSALLGGTANKPGTPAINPTTPGGPAGGTITFRAYGPSDTAVCNQSNLVFTSSPVDVSGDKTYGPVGFTPDLAGTYYWIASYTGDSPNTLSAAGTCGEAGETTVVEKKQPSIVTQATAEVTLGTSISDTATLSGATSNAAGSIRFDVYGPDDATCATSVFNTTVQVSGNGSYASTPSYTPTAAGTYRWIASYSGDANNNPVSGSCGDANESSLVKTLTPTVKTSQFFYPNDSATIKVTGGGSLAGNVRFRAWKTANCGGSPIIDQTVAVSGALEVPVETTNTNVRVDGDVTVLWWVDYDSTNPAHIDVNGSCGMEQSVIDVTDTP